MKERYQCRSALKPPGSEEAEAWLCERALQVLKGHASRVAARMRGSATLRELAPS
jgi:hypothetical protein